MPRPGWDTYFMGLAQAASTRSTCSRLQVGAVLVRDNEVVSMGYNGAPSGVEHCVHRMSPENEMTGCEVSVHAEANALIHARSSSAWDELFVTHAPCFQCSKLILNTGIHRVTFRDYYRETRGVELLAAHSVEVVQFEELTETLEMGF